MRNTRLLLLAVGGAVLVSVVLIGFGLLRDTVLLPNEPVAKVGNQDILTREFQQRVRLDRFQLIQQYDLFLSFGLQDNADQARQQLNDLRGIGSRVISTLVDEALYRQAAPELGVNLTDDDVQRMIEEGFEYFRVPPTPAPTLTPAATPTPDAESSATPEPTVTPQPTATPVTEAGFRTLYQQRLSELAGLGFSEADYRRLFETQLIAQRVRDILWSQVVTLTEQAQFQYVRASAQEDIDRVQQAIEQDGFDSVYSQVLSQTFTISAAVAIELPFTPKEDLAESPQFGPAFADAVFSTPISSTFGVITGTGGSVYYVGRVVSREVRELSPDALSRRQSAIIQDWLNQRRQLLNVQVLTWEDRVPVDPDAGVR